MSAAPIPFFDRLADRYDETWTNTRIGRLQRDAVWRAIDPLIREGDRVLDLGCGTGEDGVHYLRAGANVVAVDNSARMVEIARGKGVDARVLGIEQLGDIAGVYDLVLSNFGALNCLPDLGNLRESLARLLRPGGRVAICVMNRFCAWELVHYGLRGKLAKASRRWSGQTETSSGLRVYYPSVRQIARALSPSFRLVTDVGIGVCVPPSYVRAASPFLLERLSRVDERIAGSRIGRAIGDHRLLVFVR